MSSNRGVLIGATLLALFLGACGGATKAEPPSSGYTLHIDARKHVNTAPEAIVHHYCKTIDQQVIQCLLFDSDAPKGKLIGVETVISPQQYAALPEAEKPNWHYHRTEIPQVEATLPDVSEKEAQRVVDSLMETYGKVIIFWEPKDAVPMDISITRPASGNRP